MKPEDVARYSRAQWGDAVAPALDAEIRDLPFSVAGARVLDLAAGPGAFVAALQRAGAAELVWHDRDPLFLETARSRLSGSVRFELRDMLDLPYEAGAFDAVFLRDALHWAPDEAVLFEAALRVLAPGGWLVVTNHNYRRVLATVRPRWRAGGHLLSPVLALALRRKLLPTLWVFQRLTRRRARRVGFELVSWEARGRRDFLAVWRRAGGAGP